MLPEMDGSLAAGSRPSTSYGPGLPKSVPSHRHRLSPEQLRSTSSAVGVLVHSCLYLVTKPDAVGC